MTKRGWRGRKAFAEYAGVSPRTVSRWIKLGLPFAQVAGGNPIIHLEKADAWLEQFMVNDPSESIDLMVNDIMEDLQK